MGTRAILMFSASEHDPNMYYATRFLTPDPFLCIRTGGRTRIVVSSLEWDRARRLARVDEVIPLDRFEKMSACHKHGGRITIPVILRALGIRSVTVPEDLGIGLADRLHRSGIRVVSDPDLFIRERSLKSAVEVRMIRDAQRASERVMTMVAATLRRSRVRRDRLVHHGLVLTSERLHAMIRGRYLDLGYDAGHVIAAGGPQACDPHEDGHGPLRPGQAIVVDLSPRSLRTRYFADITRTFVRGRAADALHRQYAAVKKAQELAMDMVRPGVSGQKIHRTVVSYFEEQGYRTGEKNGHMEGFFHSTGHGVGLEIHEAPSLGRGKDGPPLKTGHVVTVEPGLYYPAVGGVRLEDLLAVDRKGAVNLTVFPKVLELR